jgi:phosphate transport system permease protein/phosphate transport system substrate-binding protein
MNGLIYTAVILAAILVVPHGITAYAQVLPPSQLQGQTINGAGATFPFPLIDTWRVEYQQVNPSVSINYQSIGSGGGVKQFTEKTVDFGATDAPLTESETSALSGPAVHIPETIGSVVAAYNIEGMPEKGLKLTGPALADIFLGKITKWDDPKIKESNPDLQLPGADIAVVHRSDGSGTTFIWTSYLSLASPEWNQTAGAGKSVQWPAGIGASGNEGVANTVKSTANSIGYVELAYALTTDMDYAFLQNQAGNFVEPSLNSTQVAVEATVLNSATTGLTGANETGAQNATINLPAGDESWSNVTLLNAPGPDSYPIASFSYLLLYKDLGTNIDSMEKARALVEFARWAITDGQQFAPELSYVPLPDSVVQHNLQTLDSLTFNGQPVTQ